jgi:aminoglycoside phosphotransferase (APT) family kinase protein
VTFKQNWEKTSIPKELSASQIEQMISQAFPNQHLQSYEVIAGGCANLNIKFYLQDIADPYILRVYLHNPQAADLEHNLYLRLQTLLPIPQSHYVGQLDPYKFAIMQFIPGITLRDHLLGKDAADMEDLMFDAGTLLAKLSTVQFDRPGFLNSDLSIKQTSTDLLSFILESLQNKTVLNQLGDEFSLKLENMFEQNIDFLPDEKEHHLVHGDYDPANILVQQTQGKWQISGILDWEFASSSTVLWDVANMLRYAHHMPPHYESSFLNGLKKNGVHLPDDWKQRTALLNISALLDCLVRSNSTQHPNRCVDICNLVHHFYKQFEGS